MYYVVTYNEIIGTHNYKEAIGLLEYLSYKHRHVFKIRCWFKVEDPNREIEFNIKQYEIEQLLKKNFKEEEGMGLDFGGMSCEMIASYLIAKMGCEMCEVLEDGFGGALVRK